METFVSFAVFFVVFGALWYLFFERKRTRAGGKVQSQAAAILRTVGTAAVSGALFILFMELMELF